MLVVHDVLRQDIMDIIRHAIAPHAFIFLHLNTKNAAAKAPSSKSLCLKSHLMCKLVLQMPLQVRITLTSSRASQ